MTYFNTVRWNNDSSNNHNVIIISSRVITVTRSICNYMVVDDCAIIIFTNKISGKDLCQEILNKVVIVIDILIASEIAEMKS